MENFENTDTKDFITFSKEAIGQIPLDIKFKKLDERAIIPTYAHEGDVGMDLTAIDVEYNKEHDMYIYHTGLAFESQMHYGQFLYPRSSNRKTDAYLCNSVGIADSAIYRGEIIICYKNRDSINTVAEIEGNKAMMEYFTQSSVEHKFLGSFLRKGFEIYNETKNMIYKEAENLSYAPYKIGDKIAQMVFMPYPNVKLIQRTELNSSERGDGAFGSTGN